MGPPGGCPNAGALDRAPDHVAQASRADRPDGRARGQKDVIRGGDETLALEVPEDRVTDVLRKRQPRLAPPLAGDPEAVRYRRAGLPALRRTNAFDRDRLG